MRCVDRDRSMSEGDTPSLHPGEEPNETMTGIHFELANIELWHEVMHIQNDFCSEKLGKGCGKDQEVRHGMDLDDLVTLSEKKKTDQTKCFQEKSRVNDQVGQCAVTPIT